MNLDMVPASKRNWFPIESLPLWVWTIRLCLLPLPDDATGWLGIFALSAMFAIGISINQLKKSLPLHPVFLGINLFFILITCLLLVVPDLYLSFSNSTNVLVWFFPILSSVILKLQPQIFDQLNPQVFFRNSSPMGIYLACLVSGVVSFYFQNHTYANILIPFSILYLACFVWIKLETNTNAS